MFYKINDTFIQLDCRSWWVLLRPLDPAQECMQAQHLVPQTVCFSPNTNCYTFDFDTLLCFGRGDLLFVLCKLVDRFHFSLHVNLAHILAYFLWCSGLGKMLHSVLELIHHLKASNVWLLEQNYPVHSCGGNACLCFRIPFVFVCSIHPSPKYHWKLTTEVQTHI